MRGGLFAVSLLLAACSVKGLARVDRYQKPGTLRVGLGAGGHSLNEDQSFAAALDISAHYGLGRFVSLGFGAGALAVPAQEAHVAALVRVQLPYRNGAGKVYVQFPLGLTRRLRGDDRDKTGWYHGLALGNELELSRDSLLYVELNLAASVFAGEGADDYSTSTRLLLGGGYGWRF